MAARAEDQYSVVTFVIDGMSQQNLIRSLPSTKSYLDSRGGLLFTGHNKVVIRDKVVVNVCTALCPGRCGTTPTPT